MSNMESPEPQLSPDTVTQKPRQRQRHEPVIIHTINPALGPLSSRALNSASTSSPSTPFPLHRTPTSAPTTFAMASASATSLTSSSASPPTTRSRADSTAATLAMEAMIEERLGQLTRRLHAFNEQSFDLYARTQALAAEFQVKARRLYQVEDHLLKIQGKPGLSEHYLVNGPQPRRLTNDLEELRMGVKTLRKKFQVAGNVVSTVGWWTQLKEKGMVKGENDASSLQEQTQEGTESRKPLTPMRKFTKKKKQGPLALEKVFMEPARAEAAGAAAGVGLEVIPEPSPSELLVSSPVQERSMLGSGLCSPPPTPKVSLPLPDSLSSVGLLPDTEVSVSVQQQEQQEQQAPQQQQQQQQEQELQAVTEAPAAMLATTTTTSATTAISEAPLVSANDDDAPEQLSSKSLNALPSSHEEQQTVGHPEPESSDREMEAELGSDRDRQQSGQDGEDKEQEHVTDVSKASNESTLSLGETSSDERRHSSLAEIDQEEVKEQTAVEASVSSESTTTTTTTTTTTSTSSTSASSDACTEEDTWVQQLWRFLARIEYIVLGTAVLGAMMPDNLYALCVGFLSAIMYAALLVHHRVTAPPGTEAPKPPTSIRGHVRSQRRVVNRSQGRQSKRSSRYGN
ncbi:hypothetical protein BGZ94_002209 [Podila epigama]|nr:hypothetical protein BGZ94_002209 [Podila epigama]